MLIYRTVKHVGNSSAMCNNSSKMYRRCPLVLLVLLLGTGDGEGVSLTCETCVVSEISEDLEDCWLVCGLASEVSVNTSVDV